MKIFIELGNTCLKLATLVSDRYQFVGLIKHHNDENQIMDLLTNEGLEDVSNVYVCSVASAGLNATLTQCIQQTFQVYPAFLTTQPESCGIVCGYDSFQNLGVDRWMAIVGGCAHSSQPTIIVDAGTALTIDMVIDKQHQGGFIVPGLGLMKQSLIDHTAISANIDQQLELEETGLLAKNTSHAIQGGTLFMIGAFLNSLLDNLESETGRRFRCIGTGGDFDTLNPMLDKHFEVIHDLTLLGMVEMVQSH